MFTGVSVTPSAVESEPRGMSPGSQSIVIILPSPLKSNFVGLRCCLYRPSYRSSFSEESHVSFWKFASNIAVALFDAASQCFDVLLFQRFIPHTGTWCRPCVEFCQPLFFFFLYLIAFNPFAAKGLVTPGPNIATTSAA